MFVKLVCLGKLGRVDGCNTIEWRLPNKCSQHEGAVPTVVYTIAIYTLKNYEFFSALVAT